MWLFTPTGFYSIVFRNPTDSGLTIRARVATDLDRLRNMYLPSLSPTMHTPLSDYPYRATVAPEVLGEALARIAEDIDYSNFKDEIAQSLGYNRAALYGRVWSTLTSLEEIEADSRPQPLNADEIKAIIQTGSGKVKR